MYILKNELFYILKIQSFNSDKRREMSNFFTGFRAEALVDKLSKGDQIKVIGKDEYKGWLGTVIRVKKISGENIYTVELEANHMRIERFKDSLRKQF